ncbi:MAG TPA: hypothetical protein VHK26_10120 [Methyloceanibacter sp.]|jgi:hypothetical protein|nr:hypothetical protein [Methyloceanibacter sp.]
MLYEPDQDGIVVQQAGTLRMARQKLDRSAVVMAIAAMISAGPASSQSTPTRDDTPIVQVKDHDELTKKFCAADANVEHIFVLPASLFVDSEQVICDSGPYKLYRIIEQDDTDDFEYFLDPPVYGKANRLGCDGKAGRTMQTIAVNCRPLK